MNSIYQQCKSYVLSRSVVSNPLQPHGLQLTRLLRPWDFPGKSTGVGCHCLLQIVYTAYIALNCTVCRASLMAQTVKNPPAVQETEETWVPSLGREDPLEKGMATHSSILGWRIPWTEKPGGLYSMGLQRAGYDWVTNTFPFRILHIIRLPAYYICTRIDG